MAQDDNPLLRPLVSLFKRLFGNSSIETQPLQANTPPLVITDSNRADLHHIAQTAPFAYGYWARFKQIYKAAEAARDFPLLSALITRLDTVPFAVKTEMLPTPFNIPFAEFSRDGVLRIQVVGSTAYVIIQGNQAGLHIVDVSDPVQPMQISHFKLSSPTDIVINGSRAYIVENGRNYGQIGTLQIFDISASENPVLQGKINLKDAVRIALMGQYAVVLCSNYSNYAMTVLDISNPQNILILSKINLNSPGALVISGHVAYVIMNYGRRTQQKIHIYDLSNPIKPELVGSLDTPNATDLALHGDILYVTTEVNPYAQGGATPGGLTLYNTAGFPSQPQQISYMNLGDAKSVAVQRRHVFVGVGEPDDHNSKQGGVRIVDVAEPDNPRLAGSLAGGSVSNFALSDTVSNLLFFSMKQERYGPGLFCIADVSRPDRPFLLGQAPSNDTLGYMKRCARRALRNLAEQDPAQYVSLATQVLISTGKDRAEVDPRLQWVTMQILFANSRRYEQTQHGRGAYLLRSNSFILRTREEAFPELWDRYPALVESLVTHAELPWQTQEAACKILRSMNRALPAVPVATLLRFLVSPSALLITTATRAITRQLANNQDTAPDLVAETYFKGSGQSRKVVREYIAIHTALGSRWTNAFANRLYKLASENIERTQLSRRQSFAFAYLVATYPNVLGRQIAPALAVLLYATRRPELQAWTLETLRQSSGNHMDQWLISLETLPDDLRSEAVVALTESVRNQEFSANLLTALVLNASAWIRATGWDLIAASKTTDTHLSKLWDDLLALETETDALRSAMASPAAITLFNRLSLDGIRLQSLLETRPFLVGLLPQSALQSILRVLPPASILGLISAATEAQWPTLRVTIADALQEANQMPAFWKVAWKIVGETDNPILTARLLEDEILRGTFLQLNDLLSNPEYLETANPIYSSILGLWMSVHADLFDADSSLLLKTATHMLPDIRAFGLERVRQIGMHLPFALRLLESELPPTVEVGKTFFDALPARNESEIVYVTALCDSPKASVRVYGLEYLEARWEHLPHEELYNRLSENTDSHMEAFLAGKMLQTGQRFTLAPTFDRQVMRQRDRGRKAKELVKRRLDTETSQDVSLLLEIARSRSSRDVEWALVQLARLAVAGVEVDGLTIDQG